MARLQATLPNKLPPVSYEAVIMVEPALIAPECYQEDIEFQAGQLKAVTEGVLKRRDTWDSREQAGTYIRKRFPYNMWNPEVVELYIVRRALLGPCQCVRCRYVLMSACVAPCTQRDPGVGCTRQRDAGDSLLHEHAGK